MDTELDWKELRRLGYWRSESQPSLPDPNDFVDHEWNPEERAAIVEYLQRGTLLFKVWGFSYCRICDPEDVVADNGSREYTDGSWVWPEGLCHYVADHDVRPPLEFVTWALEHLEDARSRPVLALCHTGTRPLSHRQRPKPLPTQNAINEMVTSAVSFALIGRSHEINTKSWSILGISIKRSVAPRSVDRVVRRGGRKELIGLSNVLRIRESSHRRRLLAPDSRRARIVLARDSTGRTVDTIEVEFYPYSSTCMVDCTNWKWAAFVEDGRSLRRWFDAMGISGPLRELEACEARQLAEETAHAEWLSAAPQCLRGMLPSRVDERIGWSDDRIWEALHVTYATEAEAMAALLRWLASTDGLGDVDRVARVAALLRQTELQRTLALVEGMELDSAAIDGVALLVVHWAAGRAPGAASDLVPATLRSRLLNDAMRRCTSHRAEELRKALGEKEEKGD